jgi:hypothetical protein
MDSMVEQSWEQLVTVYQRLCLSKRQGNLEDSQRLLHQQLPKSIAAWCRCNPEDPAKQRTELEEMFKNEKQRVDDLWLINRITSLQWKEELLPTLRTAVGQEVSRVISQQFMELEIQQATSVPSGPRHSRRVAFDDVAGVIDRVQADERHELTYNP